MEAYQEQLKALPPSTEQSQLRELDHRTSDGIDVSLLWDRRNGDLIVSVEDEKTEESFEIPFHRSAEENIGKIALEAFYHPFAYASLANQAA